MFQFPSPTANPLSPLAILPPAPAAEMSPAYSHDPAVQAIHQQLAALHCAAFVSLHGVPPQYVSIEPMIIHSHDDGPPQPVIAARLQSRVDRHSVAWFNAFGMGLTTWEEASFSDPLSATPSEGDETGEILDLVMTTYDNAIRAACRRMVRIGNTSALRNLVAFCDGKIPAQYDPDHPEYPAFRRRF